MRILLFSDTHGNTRNMIRAISKNKNIDLIIHLGDCVSDILKIRSLYGDLKYEFVQGNNDWARGFPLEKMLDLQGLKVFITHGHMYNVKYDYRRIAERGKAVGANAVFFGHTHEPEEFFEDGMLVLNPGSAGGLGVYPAKSTYCLVRLVDGRLISRFMGFQ